MAKEASKRGWGWPDSREVVTKIKKFRIHMRPREVARALKREHGMETTPELETAVQKSLKDAEDRIQPAALYTTLTRSVAEKTLALPFPEGAIAVSMAGVSIGPALASAVEETLKTGDAVPSSIWAAIQSEAVDQTLQFAVRLIQDQAKEEDCEVSAPMDPLEGVGGPASASATLLGLDRIGITLTASTPQLPAYARLAWLFWTPLVKGKSRRAESTASVTRPENVSA
jgi:hypothetical protein